MRIPCSIKLVMSALGIAYPLLLLWEIAVLFSGYNIGHASALATTLVVQLLTFIALSLLVLYMPETSIFVCIFYLVVSLIILGAFLPSRARFGLAPKASHTGENKPGTATPTPP